MEFISGLVSISFRELKSKKIIEITKQSGLKAIEWGGDVHVPSGAYDVAKAVRKKTEESQLLMPEYGSYYELGCENSVGIESVVRTAEVLGCNRIRVWASNKNRMAMSEKEYSNAVNDAKGICKRYPETTFCLECHNQTLTEDYFSAINYFNDVGCDNLKMIWQPNQHKSYEYNIKALEMLLPYVVGVHVFSWEGNNMYSLDTHSDRWARYLNILSCAKEKRINLMLEFMHDGSVNSLPQTAEILNSWIK